MASGLKFKNEFGASGGYSNGISSGKVSNWTNTGLKGSHTTVVYWDDKWGTPSSRVYMNVVDSWEGTINSDNSITLHLKSSYTMNRTNIHGSSNCTGQYIRDGRIYTDNRSQLFNTYSNCITTGGQFSSGVKEWNLTIPHGASTDVGSFYVVNQIRGMSEGGIYTDYISAGVAFQNTLPAAPYAPKADLSCNFVADSTNGIVNLNVTDWGCPGGGDPVNACKNSVNVVWSTDKEFKNIITTGVGEKSLAPNTTYYTRATINNGYHSTVKTCNFTTLATSAPYNYKFVSDQVSRITVQANYGGGACSISTVLQIREKGTANWVDVTTTDVHGTEMVTLRNRITRGKKYEARTRTTNCAGTYTSPIYDFAPPEVDSIAGEVTVHNDELDSSGLTTVLDWCYKVTAYTLEEPSVDNPIISHFEYRIEGQEEWVTLDNNTSTTSPATVCGQEMGLACGSTYELRSYQKIGSVESYSPVVKHTTAMCADVHNCVCDNLNYMTELICQTMDRIREGQKDVYANCATKNVCDPYSKTPTWESILSRITRFSQMVSCLICSMAAMDFSGGQDDEVYTATEAGNFGRFVPLSQEMTEDSNELISSVGAKNAIEDFLESTLRPIGTYEFYADDIHDLFEQTDCSDESGANCDAAEKGDKAVIGKDYYTYGGNKWVKTGEVPYLQDLGLINITKGSWAQHEWYWWNDQWQMLDADTANLEKRLSALEEEQDEVVFDEDNEHHNMMIAPINFTNLQISARATKKYQNEDVTVFLYEGGGGSTCFTLDVDLLDSNVGLC